VEGEIHVHEGVEITNGRHARPDPGEMNLGALDHVFGAFRIRAVNWRAQTAIWS
jgi:hypothetical protein